MHYARKGNRTPEVLADLILAALRIHKASSYLSPYLSCAAQKSSSSKPLKQLTTEDWKKLYKEYVLPVQDNPSLTSDCPLSYVLAKEGFSTNLTNIDFSQTPRLQRLIFSGITFNHCNFSKVEFESCVFKKVKFHQCCFKEAVWSRTRLKKTTFNSCDFLLSIDKGVFYDDETRFIDCISANESWPSKRWSLNRNNIKPLTNDEWKKLYQRRLLDQDILKFNLRPFLIEEGFSPEVEGIDFSKTKMDDFLFQDLTFKNCDFRNAPMTRSQFERVTFENCEFTDAKWVEGHIKDCIFKDSSFKEALFKNMQVVSTFIIKSDLSYAIFEDTLLKNFTIQNGQLFGSCFTFMQVEESTLVDCELTDAMLLDTKECFKIQGGTPHRVTKPIIALGWDFVTPGAYTKLIRKALQDNGALVLLYNHRNGKHSFVTTSEVRHRFSRRETSQLSRGAELIQNAEPYYGIAALKLRASEILKHSQGLVIPGGHDIEACFYDYDAQPPLTCSERTILEFALLAKAHEQKIPTMGVCRGAQMINIYFGGALLQNVDGQDGIQPLEWTDSSHNLPFLQILGDEFEGESRHHQAIDRVGEGLHILLRNGSVPKLLVSEDGNFIASQIHPEYYVQLWEQIKESNIIKNIEFSNLEKYSQELKILQQQYSQMFAEFKNTFSEQYPDHIASYDVTAQVEKDLLEDIEKGRKALELVFKNKNLYKFFIEKAVAYQRSSPIHQSRRQSDQMINR